MRKMRFLDLFEGFTPKKKSIKITNVNTTDLGREFLAKSDREKRKAKLRDHKGYPFKHKEGVQDYSGNPTDFTGDPLSEGLLSRAADAVRSKVSSAVSAVAKVATKKGREREMFDNNTSNFSVRNGTEQWCADFVAKRLKAQDPDAVVMAHHLLSNIFSDHPNFDKIDTVLEAWRGIKTPAAVLAKDARLIYWNLPSMASTPEYGDLGRNFEGPGLGRMDVAMACACIEFIRVTHHFSEYKLTYPMMIHEWLPPLMAMLFRRIVTGGAKLTTEGFDLFQDEINWKKKGIGFNASPKHKADALAEWGKVVIGSSSYNRLDVINGSIRTMVILLGIACGLRPHDSMVEFSDIPLVGIMSAINLIDEEMGNKSWLFSAIDLLATKHSLTSSRLMSAARSVHPSEFAARYGDDAISADLGDLGF